MRRAGIQDEASSGTQTRLVAGVTPQRRRRCSDHFGAMGPARPDKRGLPHCVAPC